MLTHERRSLAVALIAPAVVLAAVFSAVRPTNFNGHDNWLVISLASRGILAFPYASRPLDLLWTVPGVFVVPHDLLGHLVVHWFYLALTGALVTWLAARRLGLPLAVALLAGVFAAAWAPLDAARLNPVLLTRYAGCTVGSVAALVLFLEGWRRRRPLLGVLGAILAVTLLLALEGALPLLAGAPLVALAARPDAWRDAPARRSLLAWTAAWEPVLVLSVVPLLLAMTGHGTEGYQYQSRIGIDPHPLRLAASLLRQYAFHLFPIVTTPPSELATRSVPLAVAALALCFLAATQGKAEAGPPDLASRSRLRRAVVLGIALAALGWIGLVISPLVRTPVRTQFLSAPGVGLLLAGALGLLASRLPPRAQRLALLAAGAWIVAVGAGRTAAMQRDWDRNSFWTAQRGTLSQLTRLAPSLAPNTLVLLVDEPRSWPAAFGFRHAVHLLYGDSVVGHVWNRNEFLYPARFAADGVHCEPWPVIREAWRSPSTHHRYDEVAALRLAADGRLALLDEWPAELPPLPAGAVYAPRARIHPGAPPPSWRILARAR